MNWFYRIYRFLERIQGMPRHRQYLAVEAVFMLGVIRFGFLILPRTVILKLIRGSLEDLEDGGKIFGLSTIAWASQVSGVFHGESNCLKHALLYVGLARRRQIPVKICLGVEPAGGGLSAHAWVVCRGEKCYEHYEVRN